MSKEKVNLYKAISKVMEKVKNIEKNSNVGEGSKASYKGVKDQDVKSKVGQAMIENGLILIPKEYNPVMKTERWEEVDPWSKTTPKETKVKQSVFVELNAKYSLIHVETGESIDIPAYGHGVDSQDKAAGKATTYALKYLMLYVFLIPTGDIDDSDKTHNDQLPTPPKQPEPPKAETPPPPPLEVVDFDKRKAELEACTTLDELGKLYLSFTKNEKTALVVVKDKCKEKLTPKTK